MTRLDIILTTEQIDALKGITAKTRNEALEQVARILGKTLCTRRTWGGQSQAVIRIDATTTADITFGRKTGTVKALAYYGEELFYNPLTLH